MRKIFIDELEVILVFFPSSIILIFPPQTGPCRMGQFSILFRYDRPIWGDIDEQEASYTRADHIQAERSRSASVPGPERPRCLQAHRGLRADVRDELLNLERCDTLQEAKVLVERWRHIYNRIRPHSSLGYRPPAPETKEPWPPGFAPCKGQSKSVPAWRSKSVPPGMRRMGPRGAPFLILFTPILQFFEPHSAYSGAVFRFV